MTASGVIDAVRGALEALSLTAKGEGRLSYHDGPPETAPGGDRRYCVRVLSGPDLVRERRSCGERQIEIVLTIVYAYTSAAVARAVDDAESIEDTLESLHALGEIGRVQPRESAVDYDSVEGRILHERSLLITYT